MPDQIENHWRGDDEDCEDAGLHARMSAILNTRVQNHVHSGYSRAIFSVDFGKCKILEGKILAKQRGICQIHQSFTPPTFLTIR